MRRERVHPGEQQESAGTGVAVQTIDQFVRRVREPDEFAPLERAGVDAAGDEAAGDEAAGDEAGAAADVPHR